MTDEESAINGSERIGTFLRRERELRGVTIEFVSEFTRISTSRLQAFEEGDWTGFAAEVYVRGVVQGYARAIGLDVEDVLLRLDSESEHFESDRRKPMVARDNPLFTGAGNAQPQDRRPIRWGPILVLVLVIGFVGSAWFVWPLLGQQQPSAEPANSQPMTDATADVTATTGPSDTQVDPVHRLSVRGLDDAWISWQSDGGPEEERSLRRGRAVTITATESIVFRSGNAGGVELFLDGIPQASLGSTGSVRSRTFRFDEHSDSNQPEAN